MCYCTWVHSELIEVEEGVDCEKWRVKKVEKLEEKGVVIDQAKSTIYTMKILCIVPQCIWNLKISYSKSVLIGRSLCSSMQWLILLHSLAIFSGICPQLLNTHKPSSVAAADVNRHLATAFWCKSSSADTIFKRQTHGGRQTEIQRMGRWKEKEGGSEERKSSI